MDENERENLPMDETSMTDNVEEVTTVDTPGIEHRTLEKVMEDNFFRYSMSVIIDRALRDVRDGLKPVHRRIMYSMDQNNNRSGSKFVKSALIVGDGSFSAAMVTPLSTCAGSGELRFYGW